MRTRIVFLLLATVLLSSCQTTNLFNESRSERRLKTLELDSAFLFNPDYQYRIGNDDKISISVWGEDEFSVGSVYGIYNSNEVYGKWLMVDAHGMIEVPKFGSMMVKGLTIPELKDSLVRSFSTLLVNPIVDIKIMNKEITVLGEVRNPQVVPIDKEHNSLLEMIARTGGFEFYANLKSIKVLRQEGEHVHVANIDLSQSGDYLAKNIQLYPGDVVIVPSKRHKDFDKRVSTIIPFTTTITAASLLLGIF